MSDSERTPRDIREVEAESVAYICCSILGLPGLQECRGYIQGWLAGGDITDRSAQRIFGAAEKDLKSRKGAASIRAICKPLHCGGLRANPGLFYRGYIQTDSILMHSPAHRSALTLHTLNAPGEQATQSRK
jgi:hypothetical protein